MLQLIIYRITIFIHHPGTGNNNRNSKVSPPWVSWERDHISNVLEASSKENHSFKAQTKSTVLDSPKAAEIKIPFIWLERQSCLQYSVRKKKCLHHSSWTNYYSMQKLCRTLS